MHLFVQFNVIVKIYGDTVILIKIICLAVLIIIPLMMIICDVDQFPQDNNDYQLSSSLIETLTTACHLHLSVIPNKIHMNDNLDS